jgi:hypothetical protein
MPNKRTYFEQVPIAEIETVLQQDLGSAELLEKSATPIPSSRRCPTRSIVKQKTNDPSKGPL